MPTPLVFLLISTHLTAPPEIPASSAYLDLTSIDCGFWVKPRDLTINLIKSLRISLRPVIPDNACDLRITAPAGTKLGVAYSSDTHTLFSDKRSLQSEDLHPPRGVAGSDFRPLSKIPDCCLP